MLDKPSVTNTLQLIRNVHLVKVMLELLGQAHRKGQCRCQCSLPLSLSLGHASNKFLPNLRDRLYRYLICIDLSKLYHFFNGFTFQARDNQLISKIIHRNLYICVKVHHCNQSIWSLFFYLLNIF